MPKIRRYSTTICSIHYSFYLIYLLYKQGGIGAVVVLSPVSLYFYGRSQQMKQKRITLLLALTVMSVFVCLCFVACGDDAKNDYPVAGVWHAIAAWREESSFTFGGQVFQMADDYQIDFYFDFRPDGSVLKKSIITIGDYVMHTDNENWNILNVTWSVKNNVITLSSGKQFVIVDDEFDDVLVSKNILLRYKKEGESSQDVDSANALLYAPSNAANGRLLSGKTGLTTPQ